MALTLRNANPQFAICQLPVASEWEKNKKLNTFGLGLGVLGGGGFLGHGASEREKQ